MTNCQEDGLFADRRGGCSSRRCVGLEWKQLLSKNRNLTWCFNSQPNLAPVDVHDGNADIFANTDLFTQFTTQHQHVATLLFASPSLLPAKIVRHGTKA